MKKKSQLSARQKIKASTGRNIFYIKILSVFLLIIVAILILFIGLNRQNNQYTPPEMDETAIKGEPDVEESYLYEECPTKFDYKYSVAANLYMQEDKSLNVYFTNPMENTEYLMCEIIDEESGDVLYKSGVIKPGYYVEKLQPTDEDMENKARSVIMKVYSFKARNWQSCGTTEIKLMLQAW